MTRKPVILAICALWVAGITHLIIAPDHFSHAPAHGLFFGAVGLAQISWGLVAWARRRDLPRSPLLLAAGAALSGGIIVIWLLTHFTWTPFAEDAHAIDWFTVLTKIAELLALVPLIASADPQRLPRLLRLRPVAGLALSILFGAAVWGVGMLAEPYFPALWHSHDHHDHDHGAHDHGAPVIMPINTAGYFSIVNTGREADALVSVSAVDLGEITLHRTTIDTHQVARMDDLDGVTLTPHTRVDFAPAGCHIMLDRLPRDLYEGDTVTLTLHFASGRAVPVEFAVRMMPPDRRVNFIVSDGFQIANAWVRATRTLDSLAGATSGYQWRLPPGFPPPRVPENNPMTAEKVELGRYLFYDTRLSGNNTMSCSSCHLQERAFTDGRALPVGSTGELLPRNSPTLTNVAYNATLTWANPNLLVLERQIVIPMFGEHPVEMGITGSEEAVLARFRADPQSRQLFAAAFPGQDDPFTFNNIIQALASFIRTLISGSSPYDRYLRGDREALSASALRGMALFFSEALECHHCHTGFNMTLSTVSANTTFDERPFFNTGLYNLDGRGAYPYPNTGIHEITNRPDDMGRFRPPTLRNIALTAPYMHDGSIATLEEVIRFYMDGGRVINDGEYVGDGRANPYKSGLVAGFSITEQEIADLIAYLESLTDATFITDPRFSDPFAKTTDNQ